jgi:hypothetical protein
MPCLYNLSTHSPTHILAAGEKSQPTRHHNRRPLYLRAYFSLKESIGKPRAKVFAKTLQKKDNVKTFYMPP